MDGYKASQVSTCDLASPVNVEYLSLAGAGDFDEKLYRFI